jgi:hypothetical protein
MFSLATVSPQVLCALFAVSIDAHVWAPCFDDIPTDDSEAPTERTPFRDSGIPWNDSAPSTVRSPNSVIESIALTAHVAASRPSRSKLRHGFFFAPQSIVFKHTV